MATIKLREIEEDVFNEVVISSHEISSGIKYFSYTCTLEQLRLLNNNKIVFVYTYRYFVSRDRC